MIPKNLWHELKQIFPEMNEEARSLTIGELRREIEYFVTFIEWSHHDIAMPWKTIDRVNRLRKALRIIEKYQKEKGEQLPDPP